jgi:hypothetical protein
MRRAIGLTAVAIMTAAGISLNAQKTTQVHPGKGGSPHVKTEWSIDGANISITYGRPSLKGRDEAGKGRMEPGTIWRTGADEATTLTTDKMLMIGSLHVPAGTYTLYTIPGDKEWQLIVSKKTGQWGIPYPEGEDLGRTPMTVSKNATPVEQLTITIDDTPQGGNLNIAWGTVKATASFMVH